MKPVHPTLLIGMIVALNHGFAVLPALQAAETTNSAIAPPLPSTKSPVETFRELLDMSPAERRQALASRSPETQRLILAKVRDYESLKPDQRELRLQATELSWYLVPLLSSPPTNRAAQLALVPTNYHKLVEDRLLLWDKLPLQDQTNLLRNQAIVQYLTEVSEQRGTNEVLSPTRLKHLQQGIGDWQALTDAQREEIKERFNLFFHLTPAEQDKALHNLSDAERRQIEKTLVNFKKLSAEQRAACMRSFEKFANLSPEERQQFLKNADRWKRMSLAQRDAWRSLVNTLQQQPPLPSATSLPPLPQNLPQRRPTVVTN
jgi:hypothetical protein